MHEVWLEMLVLCNHCDEETEQTLVCINSDYSTDDILLTTYRCDSCHQLNYGTTKRSKYDTKKYPKLPLIPPEKKEQVIKESRNWKPQNLEFIIIGDKFYIGYKFEDGDEELQKQYCDVSDHKFKYENGNTLSINVDTKESDHSIITKMCSVCGEKIELRHVTKDEYEEEKFQNEFQHKLYDAERSTLVTYWEYPTPNYVVNSICVKNGHDFEYELFYVDEFGVETFPDMVDDPSMVFVSSKRGWCSWCKYRSIEVYPDKLRGWLLQKRLS